MSDDLDDLLRRAMKTLDDQVPSGYFETLPNQTLSRLEASMQTSGTSGMKDPVVSAPVVSAPMAKPVAAAEPGAPREEDSGLHDIRSLAQSTKQRLTTKRITTNPPMGDDIAATSGAWKHVALPEPAKMVSLPSLDELPSKEEVLAFEKAAKQSVKPKDDSVGADAPIGKPAFSAWADRKPKKSRSGLYAIVGTGLAAAAGVVIFMQTQNDKSASRVMQSGTVDTSRAERADKATAGAQPPVVQAIAAPSAAAAAGSATVEPKADEVDAKTPGDSAPTSHTDVPVKKTIGHGKGKDQKSIDKVETKPEVKNVKQGDSSKIEKRSGGGKDGEPDFNDLLKEAGADGQKKVEKPKLEKKSLSEADFKKGIGSVAGKAAGCYKGTQGNASVKLTIAPNGSVSKVSVTGMFSGKPEGDCVANAVRSASFAPWDGGPQTFSYAYLLSE